MPFIDDGYEIINHFLPLPFFAALKAELAQLRLPALRGGLRHADKKLTSVQALLASGFLQQQAELYLHAKVNFVRAILFDKTAKNNWQVAWHQDKTIAVSARRDVQDWGPWSIKEGCHHVQPSLDVLNAMVTLRINIDAANQHNGCLKIIPNSHLLGILSQPQIVDYVAGAKVVMCEVEANSALIMRPHVLHASHKASAPNRRRVLHIEFSAFPLPAGLAWV